MRPRTTADRDATLGWTCRSSIHTGGAGRSSIRPTIPFQLDCVWSVTLCELRPTSTTRRLSTRTVRRCVPGSTVPRSCSWGVERLSLEPTTRPSSQAIVCQCGRSRCRTTRRPFHSGGTTTSRSYHAGPDVVLVGLEPERHLDVPGLPVGLVPRRGEERPVDDLARPLRVDRDVVPESLGLEDAGEPDPIGERAVLPEGDEPLVGGVEREAPDAGERHHVRGREAPRRACRGAPPCGRRGTPRTSRRRGPSPGRSGS